MGNMRNLDMDGLVSCSQHCRYLSTDYLCASCLTGSHIIGRRFPSRGSSGLLPLAHAYPRLPLYPRPCHFDDRPSSQFFPITMHLRPREPDRDG